MSEQESFSPLGSSEIERAQAELDRLYDYLIDTYGVESSSERQEERNLQDFIDVSAYEVPRLTGVAALKAVFFGHKPAPPQFPAPKTYTQITRTIDMPILPPRNPNDTRKAVLLRRHSPMEAPTVLFQSWSERSEAEANARGIHATTVDTSPTGILYRRLGKGKIAAETGPLWFDYLSKVKEYRDSGAYESHGYGPFIAQNRSLLAAMEKAMGFTENDLEVKRALKQQYDQEQLELFTKRVVNRLADVPYTEWWRPSDYAPSTDGAQYDQHAREVTITAPQASLPQLSITQIETDPVVSAVPPFSLKIGRSRLDLTDKLFPDVPYPRNPSQLADQTMHNMIHAGLIDAQTAEAISARVTELNAPFHIGAKNEACILLRALWNEAMKHYDDSSRKN